MYSVPLHYHGAKCAASHENAQKVRASSALQMLSGSVPV